MIWKFWLILPFCLAKINLLKHIKIIYLNRPKKTHMDLDGVKKKFLAFDIYYIVWKFDCDLITIFFLELYLSMLSPLQNANNPSQTQPSPQLEVQQTAGKWSQPGPD